MRVVVTLVLPDWCADRYADQIPPKIMFTQHEIAEFCELLTHIAAALQPTNAGEESVRGGGQEIGQRGNKCNRHGDCEAADRTAMKAGSHGGASHCHDDCCEDCLGC